MDFHLATKLHIEKFKPSVLVSGEEVEIDCILFFASTPLACMSDEPKDRISESKCLEIMQNELSKKSYTLTEHLAYSLHTALKKELPMTLEILVKVKNSKSSFTYFPKKETVGKKTSRIWDEE